MANPASFLADNDALIAYNKDSRDKGRETNAPTKQTDSHVSNTHHGSHLMGNINNTVRDLPDSASE